MNNGTRNQTIGVIVSLLVVGYFLGSFIYKEKTASQTVSSAGSNAAVTEATNASAAASTASTATNASTASTAAANSSTQSTQPTMEPKDLEIKVTKPGAGAKTKKGDLVSVHYTGKLVNGTVFDSSIQRGTPIQFALGEGRVIQGWEQGILGMQVGEKRTLTIPSKLGYGEQGAGGVIPPNATLIFDVELVKIGK
jgi:FKBP-type peptidyl-prolyl cis-trans isomerase